LQDRYEGAPGAASIGRELRADYRKLLRFDLHFCGKYGHPATSTVECGALHGQVGEKNQSQARRRQSFGGSGSLFGIVVAGAVELRQGGWVNEHFESPRRSGSFVPETTTAFPTFGMSRDAEKIGRL
jgi:hypothetical protein